MVGTAGQMLKVTIRMQITILAVEIGRWISLARCWISLLLVICDGDHDDGVVEGPLTNAEGRSADLHFKRSQAGTFMLADGLFELKYLTH